MPRLGMTKPDRKPEGLRIPMTVELAQKIIAQAAVEGVTKTEMARRLLERGLEKL